MKTSYPKNLESDFFFKETKSNKKNSGGWKGGEGKGGLASVSDFFLWRGGGVMGLE